MTDLFNIEPDIINHILCVTEKMFATSPQDMCLICMNEFLPGQEIFLLTEQNLTMRTQFAKFFLLYPCSHRIHKNCYECMVEYDMNRCPGCRSKIDIRVGNLGENELYDFLELDHFSLNLFQAFSFPSCVYMLNRHALVDKYNYVFFFYGKCTRFNTQRMILLLEYCCFLFFSLFYIDLEVHAHISFSKIFTFFSMLVKSLAENTTIIDEEEFFNEVWPASPSKVLAYMIYYSSSTKDIKLLEIMSQFVHDGNSLAIFVYMSKVVASVKDDLANTLLYDSINLSLKDLVSSTINDMVSFQPKNLEFEGLTIEFLEMHALSRFRPCRFCNMVHIKKALFHPDRNECVCVVCEKKGLTIPNSKRIDKKYNFDPASALYPLKMAFPFPYGYYALTVVDGEDFKLSTDEMLTVFFRSVQNIPVTEVLVHVMNRFITPFAYKMLNKDKRRSVNIELQRLFEPICYQIATMFEPLNILVYELDPVFITCALMKRESSAITSGIRSRTMKGIAMQLKSGNRHLVTRAVGCLNSLIHHNMVNMSQISFSAQVSVEFVLQNWNTVNVQFMISIMNSRSISKKREFANELPRALFQYASSCDKEFLALLDFGLKNCSNNMTEYSSIVQIAFYAQGTSLPPSVIHILQERHPLLCMEVNIPTGEQVNMDEFEEYLSDDCINDYF
ncbi:hypothetical protein PCE1_003171 [Barthelona sp. PCE]